MTNIDLLQTDLNVNSNPCDLFSKKRGLVRVKIRRGRLYTDLWLNLNIQQDIKGNKLFQVCACDLGYILSFDRSP
jgi:hypothetical protein